MSKWTSLVAQTVKRLSTMWETRVRSLGKCLTISWASLVAQRLKHLPAMWETWVQSLGWEDPLMKGTAAHASILAWRIP